MSAKEQWSDRLKPLFGSEGMQRLQQATVLIFGCGGVGSYAIEALARSGVGRLIIVDGDVVAPSNLNRQIVALQSTLAQYKVEIMTARCKDIRSDIHVDSHAIYYDASTREQFFNAQSIDFVFEAIDRVTWKVDIIKQCLSRGIPVLTSTGMGNRVSPEALSITTLDKTQYDPLARNLRQALKKEAICLSNIPCVFSKEPPHKEPGVRVPASTMFVPAAAGLLAASYIVKTLLKV